MGPVIVKKPSLFLTNKTHDYDDMISTFNSFGQKCCESRAYGAVHKVVCHAKCETFDPLPCHALSQNLDHLKVCHKILTPKHICLQIILKKCVLTAKGSRKK